MMVVNFYRLDRTSKIIFVMHGSGIFFVGGGGMGVGMLQINNCVFGGGGGRGLFSVN